ncbi:hypothetical protein [Mesorhizobium sp. KR9-304]
MKQYVFALLGGVACAVIGIALLDDLQVGAMLGATIGTGLGYSFGLMRSD